MALEIYLFLDTTLGVLLGISVGAQARQMSLEEKAKNGGRSEATTLVKAVSVQAPCSSESRNVILLRYPWMGPDLKNGSEQGFIEHKLGCEQRVFDQYQSTPPGAPGPTINVYPEQPDIALLSDGAKQLVNHKAVMIANVVMMGIIVMMTYLFRGDDLDFNFAINVGVPVGVFVVATLVAYSNETISKKNTKAQRGVWKRGDPSGGLENGEGTQSEGTQSLSVGITMQSLTGTAGGAPAASTFQCSTCGGQFQAQPGTMVACPSCGTHNQT